MFVSTKLTFYALKRIPLHGNEFWITLQLTVSQSILALNSS